MEKASPSLDLVPSPGEAPAPAEEVEVVRKWAAEPAKTPQKTVVVQGSEVPWNVTTGSSRVGRTTGTFASGVIGAELPAAAPAQPPVVGASPPVMAPDAQPPAAPPSPGGVPEPAAALAFRVGRYEVATRIARGAMGSVYVCRDTTNRDPERLLTLKVIRQHSVKEDLAIASFHHEALIGSLFRHPNAQTVIDQGVFEEQPYLVLEYLDGGCLADLLVEETRPTPAIAVSVVLDVLAALSALHRTVDATGHPLGIIHCDVSPENILVGVDGIARLADFGSARFFAVSDQAQPFSLSKPPWMPPEQFTGDRLDSSSDIYSAGVLLWTALTGHQPFAAENYDQMVMNVMRKKVPPPSTLGAPACLDGVCMQAMSRFRDSRFLFADAFAAALRATASAENLIASREEVGRWVQRAMGDELAQRRRLIASVFDGAESSREPSTRVVNARPDRPHTSPAAEKILSSRTLFIPVVSRDDVTALPAAAAAPAATAAAAAAAADDEGDELPTWTAWLRKRRFAAMTVAAAVVILIAISLALESRGASRERLSRELTPISAATLELGQTPQAKGATFTGNASPPAH